MKRLLIALSSLSISASLLAADLNVQFSYLRKKDRENDGPWLSQHVFKADKPSKAEIEILSPTAEYEFDGFFPAVSNLLAGDYVLFTVHDVNLDAGTRVSIGTYIGTKGCDSPIRWKCELLESDAWVGVEPGEESYRCYPANAQNQAWYLGSFTLSQPCNGDLKIRCRLLDDVKGPGRKVFLSASAQTPFCNISSSTVPIKDNKKVLLIGNSFTLQRGIGRMLERIAASQGHGLNVRIAVRGGANFASHLRLESTLGAISAGGYDVVVMQDLANSVVDFARDPVDYHPTLDKSRRLANAVRKASPEARLILERVWAYPARDSMFLGYPAYPELDKAISEATNKIAAEIGADINPVGEAFALGRDAGLSLYHVDNTHQNIVGAYLKACVTYLVLYGGGFDLPVPDCGLKEEIAAKCRELAIKCVNK